MYLHASIVSYSFVNSVIRPIFFVLLCDIGYASLGAIKATLCVLWASWLSYAADRICTLCPPLFAFGLRH